MRSAPAGKRPCSFAARFVLRCSFCWTLVNGTVPPVDVVVVGVDVVGVTDVVPLGEVLVTFVA